jgi:hypothetical protein
MFYPFWRTVKACVYIACVTTTKCTPWELVQAGLLIASITAAAFSVYIIAFR